MKFIFFGNFFSATNTCNRTEDGCGPVSKGKTTTLLYRPHFKFYFKLKKVYLHKNGFQWKANRPHADKCFCYIMDKFEQVGKGVVGLRESFQGNKSGQSHGGPSVNKMTDRQD